MTAIDKVMTEKEVTNEYLAYKCGVTTNTIKNWRQGRVRMFAEQALVAASVLDVDVEDIIELREAVA